MASTGKTSLGLSQWEAADRPEHGDFNSDNMILDNAIAALKTAIAGLDSMAGQLGELQTKVSALEGTVSGQGASILGLTLQADELAMELEDFQPRQMEITLGADGWEEQADGMFRHAVGGAFDAKDVVSLLPPAAAMDAFTGSPQAVNDNGTVYIESSGPPEVDVTTGLLAQRVVVDE